MVKAAEKRNIVQWQAVYGKGLFDGEDLETQVDAGWVKWISDPSELPAKTHMFGEMLMKVTGGKVDMQGWYVFFVEDGEDDDPFAVLKLANKTSGNVEFKFTLYEPDSRFDKEEWKGKKWHVYGGPNRQFDKPLKAFKTDANLAKWLNADW